MIPEVITLILLIGLAILDWKYKQIPSIFTTAWIFILLVVNSQNILYGLLAFAFAFFLWELDHDGRRYISGVADFKVMIIVGLMIPNLVVFVYFLPILTFTAMIYAFIWMKFREDEKEIPFLPVLAFVYGVMLLSGLIG
jgi:hypothetical protein